jgi:putative hydrolase of the HAD superfamily
MEGQFNDIKVIFFDLDDTLCGYWTAAEHGLRRAFECHPAHGRTVDQMKRHWAEEFRQFGSEISGTNWYAQYCRSGEHTRVELMRRTLEKVGIFDRELASDISMTYAVERQAALELFPDALPCLDALKGRYPLGLITNGPADVQREEIEKLQIGAYFDYFLIEGEMLMGKPNPGVMRRAQEMSGQLPNHILMVGNSYRHDLQPAIRSGWKTVWVRRQSDVAPSSRSSKPEELPMGAPPADLDIKSLDELLPHLP